jgi:hypothetical protein
MYYNSLMIRKHERFLFLYKKMYFISVYWTS